MMTKVVLPYKIKIVGDEHKAVILEYIQQYQLKNLTVSRTHDGQFAEFFDIEAFDDNNEHYRSISALTDYYTQKWRRGLKESE